MLDLQMRETGRADFEGGLLCPSCKMIHGRCHDAIYPYVFLYRKTMDKKYLRAARRLFAWSDNLFTDEGSYYNDAQNDWEGITVFSVSAIARTLLHHEAVLPEDFCGRLKTRLRETAAWVYNRITTEISSPINYQAAAAEALALSGKYFQNQEYLAGAKERARYCLDFFTHEGLFFGECTPRDAKSPRGCVAVDIGYNLEESLPALLEYAEITGDEEVLKAVKMGFHTHMHFILPDGGIDNSIGTRNYKWTYWGSRTSDSFLSALERMAVLENDPAFAEVKYHYLELLCSCTNDGLLYGGPDYYRHGEAPCVHHSMCKAKGIAQLLEQELLTVTVRKEEDFYYDVPYRKRFPSIGTEKYYFGGFIADITAYDQDYHHNGHVSGGSLSLLWNSRTGPLFAASTMKQHLHEVTNSQLTLRKSVHRPLALRFDCRQDGKLYSTAYDYLAAFSGDLFDGEVVIRTTARLADEWHETSGGEIRAEYRIKTDELSCRCQTAEAGRLIIPLIADVGKGYEQDGGRLRLTSKKQSQVIFAADGEIESVRPVFCLDVGFEAWEIVVAKNRHGEAGFTLYL